MSDRHTGWRAEPIQQTLRCRHGHRIPGGWLVTISGVVTCPKCNALVWVLRAFGDVYFRADVSADDVAVIRTHARVAETLAFLAVLPTQDAA